MDSSAPPPLVGGENSADPEPPHQRQLTARLKFWAIVIGIPLLLLVGTVLLLLGFQIWQTRKLRREVETLKAEAVRLDQPVEIFNPAWGTALDAADPQRFPSRDARDPRYGALIQQFRPLGNAAQSWRLRRLSTGARPEAPLPEEAYLKHGSSFLRARDYDHAIQSFQHFVDLYPNSPASHNALGIAFRDGGRFADALESHNRAVELAPQRADLLWERAVTRLRSGDIAEVIKDCKSALEKSPDFADAHNTLAMAYRNQRDYANALTHHDRALEINPRREDFWRERALTHEANGDQSKSAADVQRAREVRSQPP